MTISKLRYYYEMGEFFYQFNFAVNKHDRFQKIIIVTYNFIEY